MNKITEIINEMKSTNLEILWKLYFFSKIIFKLSDSYVRTKTSPYSTIAKNENRMHPKSQISRIVAVPAVRLIINKWRFFWGKNHHYLMECFQQLKWKLKFERVEWSPKVQLFPHSQQASKIQPTQWRQTSRRVKRYSKFENWFSFPDEGQSRQQSRPSSTP